MATSLHDRFLGLDLGHVPLGARPTAVRPLALEGIGADVWVKDESTFGDGAWAGNKVRKLEWIIPEARRRGAGTLFTVGGIGTHWGLACALYGREHGLRTILGLVDQPVDDHVREQQARLAVSGARIHRFGSTWRLRLAAPALLASGITRAGLPWYLPAGGSNEFGTLAYVDTALEIAAQVESGAMPEPATVVVPVGSGGTVAGLALGFRLAGLATRVLGVVVNDSLPLDHEAILGLVNRTGELLNARGAHGVPAVDGHSLVLRDDWLGATYGDPTPASVTMVERAAAAGLQLEPVYTGKALAAIADLGESLGHPVLWLNTHGPR